MSEFATDWLQRLQPYFAEYGFWFALVLLFVKNLPLVGSFVPGAIALAAMGWFGRQGEEGSTYLLGLGAVIGTIAGDAVSYTIGRKAGDRMLRWKKWGKNIAAISERVRKEPTLIFFCHFETILRMVVPITSGLSRVPFRRWFLLDAAGAVVWVTCYVAAGYFLSLSAAMATGQTIGIVVVALAVSLILWHQFGGKSRRRGRAADDSTSVGQTGGDDGEGQRPNSAITG